MAARLLPAMVASGAVETFVENPYLVPPGCAPEDALFPLADLPIRTARGEAMVPVYFIGDDARHVSHLPYLLRYPGIVLFTDADLGALQEALFVALPGIGDERRLLVGELAPYLRGEDPDLTRILADHAVAVVAADEAIATALRNRLGAGLEVAVLAADPATAARDLRKTVEYLTADAVTPKDDLGTWPSVTAVVVSYNSLKIIAPCLQSLVEQDYPALDVLVVDNASEDGTAAIIREQFPSVRVIESRSNLGFAGGNNLGFRSSQADYFVLLNQDAIARRNFVRELVRVAELHDNIASVGAKMLMSRSPTLLNSAGTEINEGGVGSDRLVGEKDDDRSVAPQEVFGSSGGAILLRRSAIEHVGGFDEKFFMYFEDTDLCWRFLIAGYRNYYAPLATVLHDFHDDPDTDPDRQFRRRFMSERNRLQTLFKNADRSSLRAVLPEVKKNNRERLARIRERVEESADEELSGIGEMIKRAWRWNMLHLPSLLIRRRRVQKLRKGPVEDIRRLFLPGVKESGHQGDIMSFHDRFSAQPQHEIVMGESDTQSLGPGWHVAERPPAPEVANRWCKGRAWFYLQPGPEHTGVKLSVASPLEPHAMKLFVEDREIAARTVSATCEVDALIPEDLRIGRILEFRIESESMRPIDHDMGPDVRELALVVFSMRLVSS